MFDVKKEKAASWFKSLRDDICAEFETLEREAPAELYPALVALLGGRELPGPETRRLWFAALDANRGRRTASA